MQMRVESRAGICRMVVLLAIQWGALYVAVSTIAGVRGFHYPTERYGSARRLLRWGEGWEGHPRWSCAPGTRALRRASFDCRT